MTDRTPEQNKPLISVVLLTGRQTKRAALALRSILRQDGLEQAEVILIDASPPGTPPLPGSDHPAVRMFRRPERTAFGEMRAAAARLARGQVVAYLEEHCIALPGWLNALAAAFEKGYAAVGGEVHNANPGVGISDAIQIMNYFRWLPPAQAGEADIIVGHNAAYRRDVLLAYGDDLGWMIQAEPVLQWDLIAKGHRLYVDPAVKFGHRNEITLSSISRGYFMWNQAFGFVRARTNRWSAGMKALRVLATPVVPFVRTARMFGQIVSRHPGRLLSFVGLLPVMLLAQTSAALGMAKGYLFGAEEIAVRFADYELDIDRGPLSATPAWMVSDL